MNRYRKKEPCMKPIKRATVLLCIAAVVCAVLVYSNGTNHQLLVEKEINVSSGIDVLFRGEGMYNDTIYLTKDITVSDKAHFGSSEYPFRGTLDGRGHTIYLDYTDTSLFGYIAKEAVIRNVNFVYKNAVSVNGIAFGGVAKINDGTIENCKVEFTNLQLNGAGLFSPLVTVNRGTVSGVAVDGKVSKVGNPDEAMVLYGSVCVYNKGDMSSLIAEVEYEGFACTSLEEYENGGAENTSISAVRYDDIEGGKTELACAIVPETQIAFDRDDEGIVSLDVQKAYMYNNVFGALLFDGNCWKLEDDGIRLIIEGK